MKGMSIALKLEECINLINSSLIEVIIEHLLKKIKKNKKNQILQNKFAKSPKQLVIKLTNLIFKII